MTELKAYSGMEVYSGEWSGAIVFAKSNLDARKMIANEFNEGELGGLQVTRAKWADQYGSRSKVPIEDMIHHNWHFECWWSGIHIQEDVYYDGTYVWDRESQKDVWDGFLIGKKPVGFQNGPVFACQEYADLWRESKRLEKEFNEEWLKYFRGVVLARLPDAVLSSEGEYVSSREIGETGLDGIGERRLESISISIEFPGIKHWASLKYEPPGYSKIGPTQPYYTCANGDFEFFQAWVTAQKEKI